MNLNPDPVNLNPDLVNLNPDPVNLNPDPNLCEEVLFIQWFGPECDSRLDESSAENRLEDQVGSGDGI